MRSTFSHLRPLCLLSCLLLLICLLTPSQLRAEIDDSSLFMEAFTAFQGKDYLHSIAKLNQMGQLYPDSPLRDVSLLMLARSYQRSGDNDAAAQTINQFTKEFGTGSLSESIETELVSLGKRRQAGEKLPPSKQLRAAALKIRNEQLAAERAVAMKAEQERLAQERADRERIAREKAEADRQARERLAVLKAAREAIKFGFDFRTTTPVLEVGVAAAIPFKLINQGKDAEEFLLEASLPLGVEGIIAQGADRTQPVQKITLQPRQHADLQIAFKMPSDRVDGSRITVSAKAVSTKFTDISKSHEVTVTAAAPLLRAVSRLPKQAPVSGETLTYKVTLLNVGSKPAKDIDLRINLPQLAKLVDAGGNGCWIENEQLASCRIEMLQSGQLTERNLKIIIRDNTAGKSEKGSVEVQQTVLQVKDSFSGAAITVTNKSN
jgi:hypothetical protein